MRRRRPNLWRSDRADEGELGAARLARRDNMTLRYPPSRGGGRTAVRAAAKTQRGQESPKPAPVAELREQGLSTRTLAAPPG